MDEFLSIFFFCKVGELPRWILEPFIEIGSHYSFKCERCQKRHFPQMIICLLVQGWEEEAERKMCEIWCQWRGSGAVDCKQRHSKGGKIVLWLQWLWERIPNRAFRLTKSWIHKTFWDFLALHSPVSCIFYFWPHHLI